MTGTLVRGTQNEKKKIFYRLVSGNLLLKNRLSNLKDLACFYYFLTRSKRMFCHERIMDKETGDHWHVYN